MTVFQVKDGQASMNDGPNVEGFEVKDGTWVNCINGRFNSRLVLDPPKLDDIGASTPLTREQMKEKLVSLNLQQLVVRTTGQGELDENLKGYTPCEIDDDFCIYIKPP